MDTYRDAAALSALVVGGRKPLHGLNEARYLRSYDTGRRHVVGALEVLPNEPPTLLTLLVSVKHVEGVHLWQLLIDVIHMEDIIIVSHEAGALGLGAICCT